MEEVSLDQILHRREQRVQIQKSLLADYHCPVISFTMNIAGPVKTSPLIRRAFLEGIRQLEDRIPAGSIRRKILHLEKTGCEALYAVDQNPQKLKDICVRIEEGSALGRLFDLDILDATGGKLSRDTQRGCIVCGAPGRGCAARRIHSVSQLQKATCRILETHFREQDRRSISALAVKALLDEVNTTPKPGLVDRRNSGSHRDMDLHTFTASAKSLEPYFEECLQVGQLHQEDSPEHMFALLKAAGLRAEETMYRTTGGINTHKGVIYSMGILCGALGRLWNPENTPIPLPVLMRCCSRIVTQAAQEDFSSGNTKTAGILLFHQFGITGIRGEASEGFPSLTNIALPAFYSAQANGLSRENAGILALLHLISRVTDTNLYRRGGREGAFWASEAAKKLLRDSAFPAKDELERLDDSFIARNLSPGGCADLLALTYFLSDLTDAGFVSNNTLSTQ